MLLIIDNYDSFTFNLVQYIREIGEQVVVKRNDELSLEDLEDMNPDTILLSPGPGNPDSAGICLDVVHHFYKRIPILGVCLGQQIIAQAFGARVIKATQPMHGKVSTITHDQAGVFTGLPSPLKVARYHSLIVEEAALPSSLAISAKTEAEEIMAIRHRDFLVEGVQFHPEAILTEHGMDMLRNFLILSKNNKKQPVFI